MNIIPPPIESAIVSVLLFWYTAAWHGLLFGGGGSRSDAVYVSTEATFTWLPAYALSLALFATIVPVIFRRRLSTFGLLAVLLLCMTTGLSVFWSDLPGPSLRRSLSLTAVATFGIYLAVRFDYREVIRLLVFVYLAAAHFSVSSTLSHFQDRASKAVITPATGVAHSRPRTHWATKCRWPSRSSYAPCYPARPVTACYYSSAPSYPSPS